MACAPTWDSGAPRARSAADPPRSRARTRSRPGVLAPAHARIRGRSPRSSRCRTAHGTEQGTGAPTSGGPASRTAPRNAEPLLRHGGALLESAGFSSERRPTGWRESVVLPGEARVRRCVHRLGLRHIPHGHEPREHSVERARAWRLSPAGFRGDDVLDGVPVEWCAREREKNVVLEQAQSACAASTHGIRLISGNYAVGKYTERVFTRLRYRKFVGQGCATGGRGVRPRGDLFGGRLRTAGHRVTRTR